MGMAATMTNAPAVSSISRAELTRIVKAAVLAEGFDQVGIAAATPGLGTDRLADWIADGRQGDMDYMQRHLDARRDPNSVLEGVRSVVVAALNYKTETPELSQAGEGRISRYAWGRDYHDVLRTKLQNAAARIQASAPGESFRAVVDSAPLMERDYASLAGIGWFGKNTLLLNRKLGSFFFLGALLTTAELDADAPFDTDHCGSCTKCLDACPTNAFDGPYRLDPRRCISYLTIEHRGAIDEGLSKGMGDWIFGCDVCQDVCPWNRKRRVSGGPAFEPRPGNLAPSFEELATLTPETFQARFRKNPIKRAKRRGLLRNVAVAIGNAGSPEHLALLDTLAGDEDPIVREHAAWGRERLLARTSGQGHQGSGRV